MMVILFCIIVCVSFLIYGLLVMTGIYTPIRSKVMVEEENRKSWCKVEGFIRVLWGLDAGLFALYYSGTFPKALWLAAFAVLAVYTISITYKNNQKYMK